MERNESFYLLAYPANQELYYPGYEIFVWPEPQTMTVGGIEEGPANGDGVHYGDRIVYKRREPRGKSLSELEQLFRLGQCSPHSRKR